VDGEVLLSKGYGLANREWEIPNTPDTKFRIGSLTKQFTAMAILLLQERGLLTVEDPICMYFEECPEAWEDITIHHLLTHTSGITDFTAFSDYARWSMMPSTPENTIQRFINEPLDFAPGEEWSYSSSGYIILGYILREVSGDRYSTFLRENIFEPLGMENTGLDSNTRVIEHRADGYAAEFRADYIDMSIPFAAGGLYSTIEDLYLWDQALYSGQVVSEESWEAMMQSRVAAEAIGEGFYYAYGLIVSESSESPVVGHAGGINGFRCAMRHFPEDNTTIIILSNDQRSSPATLADVIAGILFDD
jgi:CubicO group peptidase (beta-lactamase class C family)